MPELRKRFIDTFEYIKQLVQMGQEPVYSVAEYRNLRVLENELQARPGINHTPYSDDGSPVWLEIERLQRRKAPPPIEKLELWLNQSDRPAKDPTLKEWMIVTVSADEAEKMVENGTARKDNVLESPREQGMFDIRLFAEDDTELKLVFKNYMSNKWQPWAVEEKPRRETIAIYEKFFAVNQAMMAGEVEQPIELVWGIGYAIWKVPESDKTISHPLLETLVEIGLESNSQALRIRPRSVTQERPRIFTAPFEALNIPGVKPLKEQFEKHLNQIEVEEKTIHPADPTSFTGILRSAVSLLSQDACFVPDVIDDVTNRTLPRAEESLAITDTWAIYARSRRSNYLVQDLERFQEKAKTDEKIMGSVALKFAMEPSSEKPRFDVWKLSGGGDKPSSGSLVGNISEDPGMDGTIYFPRPFNDAQREILQRLDKADGVVVQGPPGTGKTHTIANIICHYLATGRRVLVTAKSETALEVLKDQIPEQIQPLIISLVSNDREGMQQQKEAIETLQVKVVGLQGNERQICRKIKVDEEEVCRLQQDICRIDQQIENFAREQLEPLELPWAERVFENTSQLAIWVIQSRERFRWFPDEIGPGEEYTPLFGDEDIEKLVEAKRIVGEEIKYLNLDLPSVNDLPDTETIGRMHSDLLTVKKIKSQALREGIPRFHEESLDTTKTAEGLLQEIREIQRWIQETDTTWLKIYFELRVYPKRTMPGWLEILDELRPEIDAIVEDRKKYLRKPIVYDLNGTHDKVVLKDAVERGKAGKSPLTMLQRFDKKAKAIVASVTVVNKTLADKKPIPKEDWEHVEEYLAFEDRCNELVVRWNTVVTEDPIPEIEPQQAAKTFEEILGRLSEADRISNKLTKLVWPDIEKVFSKTSGFYCIEPKNEALVTAIEAIEQNLSVYRLSVSEGARRQAIERLEKCNFIEANELIEILKKRISSEDSGIEELREAWHSIMTRMRYLQGLASGFHTIRDVTEKIRKSGAVQWAIALSKDAITVHEEEQLLNWKETWRWARLNTLLRSRDIQHQLVSLEESCQEKEVRIKRVFEEVVRNRTFIMLCQSMTGRAKTGLARFMAAIANVGRGTGIKAPIFMRAAQKAMLQCAEAIPCWIMPSWRVSEVLPAEFDFFDLVIVDEASQCDVRELPAIARGKKLLIVGDDRQVSPTAPFVEFKKFLQLKHNYLGEQPFGDLMLPGYSLYDLAGAVFPGNKIILNEHFRCAEPIIRFSFQFYSGVTIHPLRIPKASERIDPPLVDVFVEDGVKSGDLNYEEVQAIVNEIEKLVFEDRYKGRSIGVISLIGRKQAALIQTRLLERIGQEKYIEHKIICGDSATFQGREKDIVFLSMVASPGRSKALTMRTNEQRFNVATSRARDRLYLIRSVDLNELKPEDLKAKLIRHFKEPMPSRNGDGDQGLMELCESNFEREVFTELTIRGYHVTPQVPVGEFRIDLVVEGENDRRLAVELDGDKYHGPEKWLEDWTRQKVLERVNWKFWRCWASSYVNDPESCLSSLVQKLETMGIKPQGNRAKAFSYTDFRRVSTKEAGIEAEPRESAECGEVVEIGDKLMLSLEDNSEGYVTVVISEGHSVPENLIFAKDHPVSIALLGRSVEDEVEVEIRGKRQKICIVQLEKARAVETDDSGGKLEQETPKATTEESDLLDKQSSIETFPSSIVARKHFTTVTREQEWPVQLELSQRSSARQQGSEPEKAEKYPDPRNARPEEVSKYLKRIVAEYGPMVTEHAYHIYLEKAQIKRLGNQIKHVFERSMAAMQKEGSIVVADDSGAKGQIDVVVKTPDQGDVVIREHLNRPIERIPKNELRALAKKVKDSRPGIDEGALMRMVLERYGLKRLTIKTEMILDEVIRSLRGV